MDRQADPELLAAVRSARLWPSRGSRGSKRLRVRKVGLEYLVDIHVEVAPDHTVRDGHAIAHAVKDRVIGQFVPIRDVLVHVEPSETQSDRIEPSGSVQRAARRAGLVLPEIVPRKPGRLGL